jgi:hypothetical protein
MNNNPPRFEYHDPNLGPRLRRSSGALGSCVIAYLGLQPEAIETQLLRSESRHTPPKPIVL